MMEKMKQISWVLVCIYHYFWFWFVCCSDLLRWDLASFFPGGNIWTKLPSHLFLLITFTHARPDKHSNLCFLHKTQQFKMPLELLYLPLCQQAEMKITRFWIDLIWCVASHCLRKCFCWLSDDLIIIVIELWAIKIKYIMKPGMENSNL